MKNERHVFIRQLSSPFFCESSYMLWHLEIPVRFLRQAKIVHVFPVSHRLSVGVDSVPEPVYWKRAIFYDSHFKAPEPMGGHVKEFHFD